MKHAPEAPTLIGGLIPENRLTLIHGTQGSGKTYSTLKMLNSCGITPFYIDLDGSDGLEDFPHYKLDGTLIDYLLAGEPFPELDGKVLIIDTYSRLHEYLISKGLNDTTIVDAFEKMLKVYNITLIIIGHPTAFVTNSSLFQLNLKLPQACAEEIWIEKTLPTKAASSAKEVLYTAHIQKNRGNGGAYTIKQWMRSDVPSMVSTKDIEELQAHIDNIDEKVIPANIVKPSANPLTIAIEQQPNLIPEPQPIPMETVSAFQTGIPIDIDDYRGTELFMKAQLHNIAVYKYLDEKYPEIKGTIDE